MNIIIEGCDKTGKSTIIQDLKKIYTSATVFKNLLKPEGKDGVTIGRAAGIYLGAYQFANTVGGMNIFDRGHITEVVYSQRRGYNSLEHIDWLGYEQMLLDRTCVIYMSAPEETIVKRFETENETYISKEEVHNILEGFDAYLSMTKLPVLRLSSLDDREQNIAKFLTFIQDNKVLWMSQK